MTETQTLRTTCFDLMLTTHNVFETRYFQSSSDYKNFYIYETLSETNFTEGFAKENFKPNLFVDISKFMNKKINLANIYESELKKHPFPRSSEAIKSLATLRGSFSNHKFAESFMILKQIKE